MKPKEAKRVVQEVGGRCNFQVKYLRKPVKSYLLPVSVIPTEVLKIWQKCEIQIFTNFQIIIGSTTDESIDDEAAAKLNYSSESGIG